MNSQETQFYKCGLNINFTYSVVIASSLNPGKKAPGSKPDFVDMFNYILLVKQ